MVIVLLACILTVMLLGVLYVADLAKSEDVKTSIIRAGLMTWMMY